jgi:CheY-like chemotaxis protein
MSVNILHIEDDELQRKLVRRILEQQGYKVIQAADGMAGIEAALAEKPDLILMNINLPKLDGYAATTRLKSESSLANTPIVALTANTLPGDRERTLVSGCDGYIPKPIKHTIFVTQVQSFLNGKRETIDEYEANYFLREYRDKLVRSLQEKIEELTRLNIDLERRVEERTRELRKTQDQLVRIEKEQAIVELIGAIGHELRQPQTVITGLIGLIMSEGYNQDQMERDLRTIVEQVKEMSRLIDSLSNLRVYRTKTYSNGIRILDLDEATLPAPPSEEEGEEGEEDVSSLSNSSLVPPAQTSDE